MSGSQAASLPSCRLDPKFFTIDLEKCDSLSDLADRIAKNQTVDKITCEPECATEWKKVRERGEEGVLFAKEPLTVSAEGLIIA